MDITFAGLYRSNPNKYCNSRFIRKNYPDVYNEITALDAPNFKTQLFMYLNGIQEVPRCRMCGKPVKFKSAAEGFCQYCSAKCSANSKKTKQMREQTCMQKYGHKNVSIVTRSKAKQTMMERYGVEAALRNVEIHKKQKSTMMERYGVENPTQAELIRQKVRQTCLERYGGVGMESEALRQKIQATNLIKYGHTVASKSEIVKRNFIRTCMQRYGCKNTAEVTGHKARQTMMERYGVESIFADKERMRIIQKQKNDKFIAGHEHLIGYTESGDWICKCPHPGCNQCVDKTYITTCMMHHDRLKRHSELCTHLLPKQSIYSSYELAVRDWLDELNIAYDANRRDIIAPKELDIYLPDFNIAIEINGCYWHSTNEKPRNYHMDKYNRCLNAGVQLITLWEDWILNEPEACRNLILYHLGLIELPELPWDARLVDLGLGSGPIKEHKAEHGGFECWDAGVFI